MTAPVIYPFFRPDFWVRGPYVPADRRRQLQFLCRRRHTPRPAGGGGGGDYDDDDDDSRLSGVFGFGKPGVHDTAIELQAIDDEQMTAFVLADEDDEDDGGGGDAEEACAGPRSPPRRTISSSTTIVASEAAGCSRQPSVSHGEGGHQARGARPGLSGSSEAAAIEETDWALQYMPR